MLRANLAARAPGVACDQVLAQPMCQGLAEVLLGYRVDAEAGPLVMLAACAEPSPGASSPGRGQFQTARPYRVLGKRRRQEGHELLRSVLID